MLQNSKLFPPRACLGGLRVSLAVRGALRRQGHTVPGLEEDVPEQRELGSPAGFRAQTPPLTHRRAEIMSVLVCSGAGRGPSVSRARSLTRRPRLPTLGPELGGLSTTGRAWTLLQAAEHFSSNELEFWWFLRTPLCLPQSVSPADSNGPVSCD